MMTKKKINEMIKDLEYYQDLCRNDINNCIKIAKELGYIVHTYEDIVTVYTPDYRTVPNMQTSLDRSRGMIYGLEYAIKKLKEELA